MPSHRQSHQRAQRTTARLRSDSDQRSLPPIPQNKYRTIRDKESQFGFTAKTPLLINTNVFFSRSHRTDNNWFPTAFFFCCLILLHGDDPELPSFPHLFMTLSPAPGKGEPWHRPRGSLRVLRAARQRPSRRTHAPALSISSRWVQ